jgi:hypothetical protein
VARSEILEGTGETIMNLMNGGGLGTAPRRFPLLLRVSAQRPGIPAAAAWHPAAGVNPSKMPRRTALQAACAAPCATTWSRC